MLTHLHLVKCAKLHKWSHPQNAGNMKWLLKGGRQKGRQIKNNKEKVYNDSKVELEIFV